MPENEIARAIGVLGARPSHYGNADVLDRRSSFGSSRRRLIGTDPATRASRDQHFKESAAPGDVHNI